MSSVNSNLLGPFLTNGFGDRYLYEINRGAFDKVGFEALFQKQFGETLFKPNRFYLIVGTDSGLLPEFLLKRGLAEGSRYIFVELSQVLERLKAEGLLANLPVNMAVTSVEEYWDQAMEFRLVNYIYVDAVALSESFSALDANLPEYRNLAVQVRERVKREAFSVGASLGARAFIVRQLENLAENRTPGLLLKNMCQGKTAVILGGGPSLDEFLPWVRENRDNVAVLAVSRISRRLRDVGLTPHMVFSVDPQAMSFEVSREMLDFPEDTIFVHSFHVAPQLLGQWRGRSLYLGPRFPWKTGINPENIHCMGPTVTNAALSVAVDMGFSQVILLGVDLCFSRDGMTHAAGSNENAAGPKLGDTIRVETNAGGQAETGPDYFSAIAVMGQQAAIAASRGCQVISPAAGAAKIPNVRFQPITEIQFDPMARPVNEHVLETMPLEDVTSRVSDGRLVLDELLRVKLRLKKIRALACEALECNDALFGRNGKKKDFRHKLRMDKIEKRLNREFADMVVLVKQFGVRDFLKMTRPDEDRTWSDEDIEAAGKIYYDAYRDSAGELLNLVDSAIKRMNSRLEEEAPSPDLRSLFDQWESDQQPGRWLLWKNRRPEVPALAQRQDLERSRALESGFFALMTEQETQQVKAIRKFRSLAGVRGKALLLFRDQDAQGLERLEQGLAQHPDRGLVQELSHLVRGYAFELAKEYEKALEEYYPLIGETFTPVTEDALRRIAVRSLDSHNAEMALLALECLAGASLTYQPQYADLLSALGRRQEAADLYVDYLEAIPSDTTVLLKLGKNYRQMGAEEAAKTVFGLVLEQDPQNSGAKTLLAGA